MNERINHIISKFSWDTSFDSKENAGQLQQRLSSWSRNIMPNEIAGVFDRMCPPGQTWKLESLEVDLGGIDYDNLEYELAKRLRKQLAEKLTDYILYANRGGNSFEIINQGTSHIQMIGSFLLQGVMPWNYKSADGELNQMLTYQLQNNLAKVIEMIREVGITHQNVRRRMAWQINEANIIRIIEGLEPVNNQQIVDFSNEMVKIQAKETIVQTSIADLKRNIWFWVFNYLFTDRGTVFNRVAFMKSNIQQMADHYNISYDELFALIERAVAEINKATTIKADFIATLKILSNENKRVKAKLPLQNKSETDQWLVLENHFRSYLVKRGHSRKAELNALVLRLSVSDISRFRGLLINTGYNEKVWELMISDMDNPALEAVVSALNSARQTTIVNTIYWLEKLGKQTQLNIKRDLLWKAGVKFLYENQSTSFNERAFLKYCVDELSKTNGADRANVLYQLLNVNIKASDKSIISLDLYDNLKSVFIAEASAIAGSKKGVFFLREHFKELICTLSDQFIGRTLDKALFVSLQKSLINGIELYPDKAMQALMEYPDKDNLKKILSYITNGHVTSILIKTIKKGEYSVVLFLEQVLSKLKNSNNALAAKLLGHLHSVALGVVILYPKTTQIQLLQIIMKELSDFATAAEFGKFERLVYVSLGYEESNSLHIPAAIADKLHKEYALVAKQSVMEKVARLMSVSTNKQVEIGEILLTDFNDKEFISLRNSSKAESRYILDYLLTGGNRLMHMLIKHYLTLITAENKSISTKNISKHLTEIYWACILSYADHKGKTTIFKAYFKAVVQLHYPVLDKQDVGRSGVAVPVISEHKYLLKNGGKISRKQLFALVTDCLNTGAGEVTLNKSKAHLDELLKILLEEDSTALRRILANVSISKQMVLVLKRSIPVSEFVLMIANDMHGNTKDAIVSIGMLYDVLSEIAPVKILSKILDECWLLLLKIIKTNTVSAGSLNKLVAQSLLLIAKETSVNAESIITALNRADIRINKTVKNALDKSIPAFAILYNVPLANVPDKKLLALERVGLLDNLTWHLVTQNNIPTWYGKANTEDVEKLLNQIVIHQPVKLLKALKQAIITGQQMLWLHQTINFDELIRSIGNMNKARQSQLAIMHQFYLALANITMAGIPAKQLQFILFRKVLKAWTTGNWDVLSTEQIWNELLWDVYNKNGITIVNFISEIEKQKHLLPPSLHLSFVALKDQVANLNAIVPLKRDERVKAVISKNKQYPAVNIKNGIAVHNAGCVLISTYFTMLFERLGIMADHSFLSEDDRQKAVHYLQYVVTGLSSTEELYLPLNKVLCGIPVSEPIIDGITVSEEDVELVDGLINAVIAYWPAIGNCSVDGFRGNWLVRDGLLTEYEDKWELVVEKRAYDLLIHKSPFSFSIIKYPWMDKPLHVTWPY